MSDLCQFLEWDSDFFAMRIARLRAGTLTTAEAQAARAWCTEHTIDCAYYLAEASDAGSARAAASVGFRYVDTRLTLEAARPNPAPHNADTLIRLFQPGDLAALQAIACVSHTDTRFYFDGRFPRERCDALYATWIARDAARGSLFVAEREGLTAGYITTLCEGECGEIGLLGVAEVAQGGGLGRALIAAALAHFAQQGMQRVQVVTQGRNLRAQRAYLRAGFQPVQVETWWHG